MPVKQVVKLSGQGGWGRRPGSRRQVTRSLQCRRILGRRNLVRVRNIVVAAIFDFMTVEDWGESELKIIVTLTVGARAKEGKGKEGGEKKISSLSPPPPHSL